MRGKVVRMLLVPVVLVAVVLSGCGGPATEEAGPAELPDKIVVGCLEPLTGAHAVFGTEAKIGMEIAIRHINEAGGIQSLGGIPLELVVEDAGETADSARLGAESIISKHHPVAILGLYISRLTVAASEVTEREKVILIADALVDSVTAMGRQYLFRPAPKASQHGASAVQFVVEAAERTGVPIERIAILNEDSSFGRSNATGAMQAALDNGLTIVYQKEYPFDIADVSSIVNEIAAAQPDVVVHCPYFMDAILFANTFRETGEIPKFISGMGACGYTDPESIEALGETAEYYSNTYSYNPAKDTPQNRRFVEDFVAETGHIPTEAAGMNYYAMWVLKEALELSGQLHPDDPLNPDNLRDAFLQLDLTSGPAVETYPGDRITFTETGDNPYAVATIMQVINGEPKVVWPFDAAEAEFVFPRPDAKY
ncbi:MAG TPA: ABC transporter substrate-binding protein [Thermoflexia bacterium]|nr:ABC transporter substrate-binding protein [Thermoflexia bacterium]